MNCVAMDAYAAPRHMSPWPASVHADAPGPADPALDGMDTTPTMTLVRRDHKVAGWQSPCTLTVC